MDTLLLSIRHFKLISGEEIVALIKEKDDGTITIERPYLVKNNLIGGFAFIPWFPFSSQKIFKIQRSNIVHHVEIDPDMKEEYIKLATGYMKPRAKTPEMKSEEEILKTLEEELYDEYEEELEEITIH